MIIYLLIQSLLLAFGQVFLKIALKKMLPFAWSREFWASVFLNWQFALCGILFGSSAILWMYIVKHFPLSSAYPITSISYVICFIAAMIIFHEDVTIYKWIGMVLIVAGCFFIAK